MVCLRQVVVPGKGKPFTVAETSRRPDLRGPTMSGLAFVLLLVLMVQTGDAIYCYSCDSSADFSCSEFWDHTLEVNAQYYSDCSDVYDAKIGRAHV